MGDTLDIEQKLLDYGERNGRLPIIIPDQESAEEYKRLLRKPALDRKVIIDINQKQDEENRARRKIAQELDEEFRKRGEEIGERHSRWVNTDEGKKNAEENLEKLKAAIRKGKDFPDGFLQSEKNKTTEMDIFLDGIADGTRSLDRCYIGDTVRRGMVRMDLDVEGQQKLEKELREWRRAEKLQKKLETNGRIGIIRSDYTAAFIDKDTYSGMNTQETIVMGEGIRKGWEKVMVKSMDGKQKNTGGNI